MSSVLLFYSFQSFAYFYCANYDFYNCNIETLYSYSHISFIMYPTNILHKSVRNISLNVMFRKKEISNLFVVKHVTVTKIMFVKFKSF